MKNKGLFARLGSICLVLVLTALLFVSACAAPTPTPTPAPTPTPTPAPTPAPTPTPTPAPPPAPKPTTKPIVLKTVAFLPGFIESMHYVGVFRDRINERSKGELIIDWIGGPEIIPGFDLGEAVRTGVIDMTCTPSAWYKAQLPEAHSFHLSEYTPAEERESGFYDFMVKLHKEKMNTYYLGRIKTASGFVLFLGGWIDKPQDIAGLKIAGTEINMPFMYALGATPLNIPPMEIYTAMERGLMDGFMDARSVVAATGAAEVTDYMVDHEFYQATNLGLQVNLDTWNKMPKHLQQLMIDTMIELEPELADYFIAAEARVRQKILDAGTEVIMFSPADADWYVETAYRAAWEDFQKELSPESYNKLREVMRK